ncbi:MAG: hypothetical protein QXR30_04700 [Candidatus Woesearchaeota archaeon]
MKSENLFEKILEDVTVLKQIQAKMEALFSELDDLKTSGIPSELLNVRISLIKKELNNLLKDSYILENKIKQKLKNVRKN